MMSRYHPKNVQPEMTLTDAISTLSLQDGNVSEKPADQAQYKYDELSKFKNQIRLLQTQPSPRDGDQTQIRCAITTHDLRFAPPYTAVSYVWGPADPNHQVVLSGHSGRSGMMTVRDNLYGFLLQAQASMLEDHFWIDPLSINQMDVGERGRQVQVIGYIFELAKRTIGWLGKEEAGLSDAENAPGEDSHFFAWRHIDKRTYWSRLWIAQEVCLSHRMRFMLGRHCLDWDAFLAQSLSTSDVRIGDDDDEAAKLRFSTRITSLKQAKESYRVVGRTVSGQPQRRWDLRAGIGDFPQSFAT